MTAREMLPAIGASVAVRFEELTVNCIVRNVKSSYGRTRLLVAPTAGSGEQWIELPRVTNIQRPGVSTGVKRTPKHECQNCGRMWLDFEIKRDIENDHQRVAPGERCPSGECPDCGALTHEVME